MSEDFIPPTPGPEHELLKPFEGTFRTEVQMWFGPDQWMTTTGTMINRWELNGLYLRQDYKGDAVDGQGPCFEGAGYWGFNTVAGRYEGMWVDTASTVMQTESGQVDETGKVWTMLSEIPNPHGEGTLEKRSVITLIDDNHHKMEMFIKLPDGSEMKNMELTYVRS